MGFFTGLEPTKQPYNDGSGEEFEDYSALDAKEEELTDVLRGQGHIGWASIVLESAKVQLEIRQEATEEQVAAALKAIQAMGLVVETDARRTIQGCGGDYQQRTITLVEAY